MGTTLLLQRIDGVPFEDLHYAAQVLGKLHSTSPALCLIYIFRGSHAIGGGPPGSEMTPPPLRKTDPQFDAAWGCRMRPSSGGCQSLGLTEAIADVPPTRFCLDTAVLLGGIVVQVEKQLRALVDNRDTDEQQLRQIKKNTNDLCVGLAVDAPFGPNGYAPWLCAPSATSVAPHVATLDPNAGQRAKGNGRMPLGGPGMQDAAMSSPGPHARRSLGGRCGSLSVRQNAGETAPNGVKYG